MSWLDSAAKTVSNGFHSVTNAVSNTAQRAGAAVSNWVGQAPNTADAATARGGAPLHHDEPSSWWGRLGQTVGDLGRGIRQEGLRGVVDPAGMLDRQRAQRDLSDRFQVMPDNFQGPRASNQVSQAEYQRIAHTFSDIRTGRGDLQIDGSDFSSKAGKDRSAWEQGTQSNLADMMMTSGGRSQITGMSNNVTKNDDGSSRRHLWGFGPEQHHQTTIKPLFGVPGTDKDGKPTWVDPGADRHDASTMRYDNATTTPQGTGATRDYVTHARGTGTDSEININPGNILGLRTDVVLAHEMQHAFNQTQGTNAARESKFGVGPDANVRNSERQAVGLTRSDSPTGGHFPGDGDGCTENTYREQRNELGDRFLPRTRYSSLPGEAPATTSDEELRNIWTAHKTGPNVPQPAP